MLLLHTVQKKWKFDKETLTVPPWVRTHHQKPNPSVGVSQLICNECNIAAPNYTTRAQIIPCFL